MHFSENARIFYTRTSNIAICNCPDIGNTTKCVWTNSPRHNCCLNSGNFLNILRLVTPLNILTILVRESNGFASMNRVYMIWHYSSFKYSVTLCLCYSFKLILNKCFNFTSEYFLPKLRTPDNMVINIVSC